jgi:hypothetical protein
VRTTLPPTQAPIRPSTKAPTRAPPKVSTTKPFRGPSYLPLPKISTEKPPPYVERTYTFGTFPTFQTRTWRHITGSPGTYTYRTTTSGTTTTTARYVETIPENSIRYNDE